MPSWRKEEGGGGALQGGGEGGYGGVLHLCNDMSHMTVLFISHWPEPGHKATSSCKGGWERKCLFWAAVHPYWFS